LRTELTGASRNQGKSSKGKKNSLDSRRSQTPCGEILVTSTLEVGLPRVSDFTFVLLNEELLRLHRGPALGGRAPAGERVSH
jgi:hypothetical protein